MQQRTIFNSITLKGIGLHSGIKTKVTLRPAEPNTGINFVRTDISPNKFIAGIFSNVEHTMLATQLAKDGIEIKTIEHLYSALAGLNIDNILIEIDGPEVPIMDGSSAPFIFALKAAGIKEQNAYRKFIKIKKDIIVKDGDKFASFTPFNGTRATFEINYNNKLIDSTPQKAMFDSEKDSYIHTLSRARTFGFAKDVNILINNNCILGGNLENAILVNEDSVLNAEGLRLNDEFVKHKLLDAIGDLYLLNHQFIGEYHGYKSGHTLNNKLINALMSDQEAWEFVY